MRRMTDEETWRWLAEGNRPAVFASLRADGRPHAVPTWYAIDGRELVFTTWHTTVKAANLRRDARVTLVVQDPAPPYDYVSIEGEARLVDDFATCRAISTLLGAKYMGADRAEEFGVRNGSRASSSSGSGRPGSMACGVSPTDPGAVDTCQPPAGSWTMIRR